jgi:hypothetical protein
MEVVDYEMLVFFVIFVVFVFDDSSRQEQR